MSKNVLLKVTSVCISEKEGNQNIQHNEAVIEKCNLLM